MQKNIGSKLALYPMPVLFEFPNYTYLRTGDTIGNCLRLDNK